jgi:hypothetical protein
MPDGVHDSFVNAAWTGLSRQRRKIHAAIGGVSTVFIGATFIMSFFFLLYMYRKAQHGSATNLCCMRRRTSHQLSRFICTAHFQCCLSVKACTSELGWCHVTVRKKLRTASWFTLQYHTSPSSPMHSRTLTQ